MWKHQPDQAEFVRLNYWDDPVEGAAARFAASGEWGATRDLLGRGPGRALDLGAGRGIASYALAKDGWDVVALEPSESAVIGAQAIRTLSIRSSCHIEVETGSAEQMQFNDSSFDAVYMRQVLHHVEDLEQTCRQIKRILKPGGRFLAAREHVISRTSDLNMFLASHPMHKLCGGENAHLLEEYVNAIAASGMRLLKVVGPWESEINYYPFTAKDRWGRCCAPLIGLFGWKLSRVLVNEKFALGRLLLQRLAERASRTDDTPGRLYTFLAEQS